MNSILHFLPTLARDSPADVYNRVYSRIAGTSKTPPTQEMIPAESPIPPKSPTISDDEAFYRINRTEKGRALWEGNTRGYKSASEADAALMVMLAGITGGDECRMKQLFLGSALGKRDKSRRDDYLSRTIAGACKYVSAKKNEQTLSIPHPEETPEKIPQGRGKESRTAIQACRKMAGKLPDIRRAGDGIYIIIDPE